MKCLLLLVIAATCAVALANIPAYGGKSNSYRKQDDYGNYAFGYNIIDPYGATNGREEKGDGHGNVVGSYSLTDVDGRVRKVNYVADGHGFRAAIDTNEPGTGNADPAAVIINGPDSHTAGSTLREDGHIPPQYNAPLPLAHGPLLAPAAPLLLKPAIGGHLAGGHLDGGHYPGPLVNSYGYAKAKA